MDSVTEWSVVTDQFLKINLPNVNLNPTITRIKFFDGTILKPMG